MSNIKFFLKVLKNEGYPNPNLLSIAKASSYDLSKFMPDLLNLLSKEKFLDFVQNSLLKLYDSDDGIRVNLEPNGFVYFIIKGVTLDKYGLDIDYKFGKSKILSWDDENEKEVYKTLEQIQKDSDMGEMSDVSELIDVIYNDFLDKVYNECGFVITN